MQTSLLSYVQAEDSAFRLLKVISGGQTGADIAALEAAHAAGLETGGTAAYKFKNELGYDPRLPRLGLTDVSASYIVRTQLNVDNSDGTVAVRLHFSRGTDMTIGYAQKGTWKLPTAPLTCVSGYKPVLVVDSLDLEQAKVIAGFIRLHKLQIVNFAGHRESTSRTDRFEQKCFALFAQVFRLLSLNAK